MAYEELCNQEVQLPAILRADRYQLQTFATLCQQMGTQVMQALSKALGMSGDRNLERLVNDRLRPSDTALKFVNEPTIDRVSDVIDNTHTDNGLLSMVWYDGWGFKIKEDADDFGLFTQPTEGRVLIHVANTLQRLTDGRLRSTLHQVTQPLDGATPRLFIAYNIRPYLD